MAGFKSEAEFRKVFEQIFRLMNEHDTVGKGLYDAKAPHRFEITDFGLEFNVTHTSDAEAKAGKYLRWVWGAADWDPVVTMRMSSDIANRFFQGKENVAMAVMLGKVKLKGPMSTIMQLAPVTSPVQPVYRQWLEEHGYDHLLA